MTDIDYTVPDIFPLTLNIEASLVQHVRLDEAAYRAASFLDNRLLEAAEPGQWAPWTPLERAAASLIAESDFIFHLGHVGSTLLSRLLGESERVFSLREPAILRTLAAIHWRGDPATADVYLGPLLKLYARVYHPRQKSLVKATSYVGAIGGEMMRRSPSAKAILLAASPVTYLTTILAGPNSRATLREGAAHQLDRLNTRLGRIDREGRPLAIADLSDGEAAALGWACELRALADVAEAFAGRILWLDVDDFLAKPAGGLAMVLSLLHGEAPGPAVDATMRTSHLSRYSKDPTQAYDTALRFRILAEGRRLHAAELRRGLAWLDALGAAYPAITDAARLATSAPRIA